MLAFVVIILISFSILSMIVAKQVMDYSTQIKDDELSRIANKSEDMISLAYKNSEHSNFTDFVNAEYMMLYGAFEFIDSGDETNVVLADINGKILWCTQLDAQKETYVDQNKIFSKETI